MTVKEITYKPELGTKYLALMEQYDLSVNAIAKITNYSTEDVQYAIMGYDYVDSDGNSVDSKYSEIRKAIDTKIYQIEHKPLKHEKGKVYFKDTVTGKAYGISKGEPVDLYQKDGKYYLDYCEQVYDSVHAVGYLNKETISLTKHDYDKLKQA